MNKYLQAISDLIQQGEILSAEQKTAVLKSLKDADKELEITAFKLDRTEKVKRTTSILLEETIEELEQKRKAVEAQNKELEIESSLERVRSVAMSMRKPEEIIAVCEAIYKELNMLGFQNIRNAQIAIKNETKESYIISAYSSHESILMQETPYESSPLVAEVYDEPVKSGNAFYQKEFSGQKFKDWRAWREGFSPLKDSREAEAAAVCFYLYTIGNGHLGISTFNTITNDQVEIIKRFKNVFELSYQRFIDVANAVAQAREAQIEVALERVRSRTMGMQKSEELKEIIKVVYEQFVQLNILIEHAGFILDYKERDDMHIWLADKHLAPSQITIPYFDSPHWNSFNDARERGENFFANYLPFEVKNKFYRELFEFIPGVPEKTKEYYFNCPGVAISTVLLDNVGLYIENFSAIPYSDEENATLLRFGKVFQQTYTRFLDLQKAEAQVREAQIEGALEKVRSRTLAMQKSDELAETAAVLFQQLIALGIEPNRLYISIVKDDNGDSEFWITDEDGSKVSTAYTANLNDNLSFSKMYEGWKLQKKSLVIDMQGKELSDYFLHLTSLGVPFKSGLSQKRRVQDIAYFSKGFIGMASPDEQPAETLQLMERFAYVFNLTFTRFSDLKIAEAHALQAEEDLIKLQTEKKRAEDALTELQAAQKQLIQSEKMASLGELTAGIAHEIQNPLNFVNNFSEVNRELLQELQEEIEKGNFGEVQIIANDIAGNEEKISHHGKRADAIVKGMLQHSRSTSNIKEATDINALADEYLRLAYHGLRAKDNSFNAAMRTDYDESMGKLNIIPQDIGRVILNIITNAFYAVNEKKKSGIQEYEPTISISTKKTGANVEIIVKDNGNGIQKKIVDKIFQPFFTTKPTGQGTGLGLSLSYDIIRAHGGEIGVETKEGEGTTFIVQLPIF